MNKLPVVFYHGNCYDGTGAALAYQLSNGNADFRPCYYGIDINTDGIDPNTEVYFLDFVPGKGDLINLSLGSKQVIILDHHVTAQKILEEIKDNTKIHAVFDMNRSGAGITWDYFNPGKPRPALINYIEDRDLWKFVLPYSKEVNAYISSKELNIKSYLFLKDRLDHLSFAHDNSPDDDSYNSAFNNHETKEIVGIGTSIIDTNNILIKSICKNATLVKLDGYLINMTNSSVLFSEVANELSTLTGIGGCWYVKGDKVNISLRTNDDDIDLTEICKPYGGGGHRKASGMRMELKKFMKLLQDVAQW